MSRFGEYQGYTGEACAKCGRVRVERYSNGFEVCEKCRWCPQLGYCVPDDEYYADDFDDGDDAFAIARKRDESNEHG